MRPEPGSRAALIAVPAEVSAQHGPVHHGPDAELARPLSPKATALHLRRQRAATLKLAKQAPSTNPDPNGPLLLSSEDGALSFSLQVTPAGFYVERTQRRPLDAHLVQAMLFEELEAFLSWCEADPVRFDHPLVYLRLRRHGNAHLPRRL
ncbi:MAG: hypothetical protein IPJ08_14415 [Burkholderiales bacterium]|nr:hypothetical protein [Burkholderiales bacterium]